MFVPDIRTNEYGFGWRKANTWHYRYAVLRFANIPQDKIFRVMAELAKLGV